ncbi:hypothetical protein OC844_001500 [Tilletia horrida]|nr:hypothetical protein OC844_001500 [Tilletia horrida]
MRLRISSTSRSATHLRVRRAIQPGSTALPTLASVALLLLVLLAVLPSSTHAAELQRIARDVAPAHSAPRRLPLLAALDRRGAGLSRRDSSYLCKCTCFGTNTTLVPLFAPLDPSKPCTTCTKQFCLDTLGSTPACKGAKIMASDGDTGTGWEGDIWAKCFQRDGGKDRTIVLLYVLTVLGLLVVAALRQPLTKAYEEYRQNGPSAMLRSITSNAPWYRQAQRARR